MGSYADSHKGLHKALRRVIGFFVGDLLRFMWKPVVTKTSPYRVA